MNTVRSDFWRRSTEVRRYFNFVLETATGAMVLTPAAGAPQAPPHEQDELIKTLKASCYLILYNLVESTMRNLIDAIFDTFRAEGTRFDDCRDELKKMVLNNFRARSPEKIFSRLIDLAKDVVTETFESKETFSGNIDAREIRETANRFGFSPPSAGTGWMMKTVKDHRNDLAHGNKSFSEIGKDTTPDALRQARKQTVVTLLLTMRNVKAYLSAKHYLSASAVP